ncbi:hypothetical protein BDK51DRAFT_28806 [Blyttiomyces helicus]|uniref:G-patch domain-containing protein n=1 Tax=Blyttiomyces helicus TaxID=388810 RepID=A0A4P9WB53_9FUNG|nr:hypothetical protein BDK51DRAFT_28806 [Blyttiomyces helicus]|eukprot:RKO88815.1 hypothetical protein BDK51DRAFT_28806 [Blyttiomyces helicus]
MEHDTDLLSDPLDEADAFHLPRTHIPSSYLSIEPGAQSSMDLPLPSTNIGFKLLLKMGWSEGRGLGSRGEGRVEPIRIDLKEDKMGVGKLEELNTYHLESTAKRRTTESERIAEETEEGRVARETLVQKREQIREEIKSVTAAFYCALCDKQYQKISEYETHLSSYDHHHRKVCFCAGGAGVGERKAKSRAVAAGEREKMQKQRLADLKMLFR